MLSGWKNPGLCRDGSGVSMTGASSCGCFGSEGTLACFPPTGPAVSVSYGGEPAGRKSCIPKSEPETSPRGATCEAGQRLALEDEPPWRPGRIVRPPDIALAIWNEC